jgi:serine protease
MRRTVVSVLLLLFTATAFAAETKRYFVGTRSPMSDETVIQRLYRDADAGAQPRGVMSFRHINAFAADLTDAEVSALKKSANVTYVEPVLEMRAFVAPLRNYQSGAQTVPAGIDKVLSRDAWVAGRGAGVNVVIIDTGVDYNHPDLKPLWRGGDDFVNNDGDPMDDAGHGTHVAGIAAAIDDDNGVVGVAPNVRLWAVKVLNEEGTGSNDKFIRALDWTITRKQELGGNWVINASLGHAGTSVSERNAINRALDAGIIVVAASGNESAAGNIKAIAYPAGYPNVLAVGAIDSTEAIAEFSNQGAELDLVAPGVEILSTVATGFGSKTYVGQSNDFFYSLPLTGSPRGTISGDYVYCGLGGPNDFPASVAGKIALIQRGEHTFAWKARRAKEAGAVGVVIFNSANPASPGMNWTLRPVDGNPTADDVWMAGFEYPVTISMVHTDGLPLSQTVIGRINLVNEKDDYDVYQGTSMSSPHVAGAAALIWALAPEATASQVRTALLTTARDLGVKGQDPVYGHGLVNVVAAAKQLAPGAFAPPIQTNPKPTTGRKAGRR